MSVIPGGYLSRHFSNVESVATLESHLKVCQLNTGLNCSSWFIFCSENMFYQ